ncbi:MAG: helix-turn-helix domain-containing protein [Propionibacteriaceae bacterium]
MTTSERIRTEALRLFADRGYAGTTITDIERAAGLSPGSGSVYRHYPTKRAILEAGVADRIDGATDLAEKLADSAELDALPLPQRLVVMARTGLRRLEEEGDLTRLVLRDLSQFPDLLARVGNEDIGRTFAAFGAWLRHQSEIEDSAPQDWDAVAMVLMGAVTHFWIVRDVFGQHPTGMDEDRYLAATTAMALALLQTRRASAGMNADR